MASNSAGDFLIYAPRKVLLFSGKRKSGKDFITDALKSLIEEDELLPPCVTVRLSAPIKKCYADENGLDFQRLLDASDYKEQHRKPMIEWSESVRNKDAGFFCRAALKMAEAEKFPVWIVPDCRRKSDFQFFESAFPSKCWRLRVKADDKSRVERGFLFTQGVDDAESECGLDDYKVKDLKEDLGRMKLNSL